MLLSSLGFPAKSATVSEVFCSQPLLPLEGINTSAYAAHDQMPTIAYLPGMWRAFRDG